MSCRVLYYIMDFTSTDFYGFISFTLQLERIIIDYITKATHFKLFRMGQSSEVLAVFFYQQTPCQYYYGTVSYTHLTLPTIYSV